MPQKISYLQFWTTELKNKAHMTPALKMIPAIALWLNQISSAIKTKWNEALHSWTDITLLIPVYLKELG